MADEPEETPIQSVFAQQFADALAANRKEQEEVTAQIAELQKLQRRLAQLKVDEAWLAQAQGSLPGAPALSEPEAEPAAVAAEAPSTDKAEQPETSAPAEAVTDAPQSVPQQRQDGPVNAEQPKQPTKKAATAKKKTAAKTTAKKTTAKAAKKTVTKKASAKTSAAEQAAEPEAAAPKAPAEKASAEEKPGPPLRELILALLLKTPGEPQYAREVSDQLAQEHPSRATSIQTVRNVLNRLAEKDVIEKANRQGSPMYTAYTDKGKGETPAADEPAGEESVQAPETAAEKVPAEV